MTTDVNVIDEYRLSNGFLGQTMQTSVITADLHRVVNGFIELGVGPWRVYNLGPHNLDESTYNGEPEPFGMTLALAFSGTHQWEVVQPTEGRSVYRDFLDSHGDGVQHIGQLGEQLTYDERVAEFARRGLKPAQSGSWQGLRFAYYDVRHLIGTVIEIFDYPTEGYPHSLEWPEPDEWIPARPPVEAPQNV